jgi:hypothetical protein
MESHSYWKFVSFTSWSFEYRNPILQSVYVLKLLFACSCVASPIWIFALTGILPWRAKTYILFVHFLNYLPAIVLNMFIAFTDKPERNCVFPAPGRNCMTHRQAQTATAAKIIHTTVQLCVTSCLVLVIVFVDMVRYSVSVFFLYESYVKCGSSTKCRRRFRRKFPWIIFPSIRGVHELINEVRSSRSVLDKKPAKKTPCAYRRRNRGLARTHTTEIIQTPCTKDWHLEIVSSQSDRAVWTSAVQGDCFSCFATAWRTWKTSLQNEPCYGRKVEGKHTKRNFGSSVGRTSSGGFQLI